MIFYICNGKKSDCKKTICCYTTNGEEVCFHTTNPDFAQFGPLKEGSVILANAKEKERPLFYSDEEGNFWEGFIPGSSNNVSNKEVKWYEKEI